MISKWELPYKYYFFFDVPPSTKQTKKLVQSKNNKTKTNPQTPTTIVRKFSTRLPVDKSTTQILKFCVEWCKVEVVQTPTENFLHNQQKLLSPQKKNLFFLLIGEGKETNFSPKKKLKNFFCMWELKLKKQNDKFHWGFFLANHNSIAV